MLKQDWFAVPDGQIYPVMFPKGTILTGEMLRRADELGLIEVKAHEKAPENKRIGRRK